MAGRRGYGFLGGLVEGFQIGDELVTAESRRKSAELEDQAKREKLDEDRRVRRQTRERETAVAAEMTGSSNDPSARNYENSMDTGGQVVAPRQPKPYEAYERAALSRLSAGDTEGYESFLNKSTSLKTLALTSAFNDAYRRGDVEGILAPLNKFPDGQEYSVDRAPDGRLVATAKASDGRVIGQMQFNDIRELGAFVQQRINPGDIHKMLTEEAKARIENNLKVAQTGQAQATTTKTLADARTEDELRAPRVALVGAQTAAANANATQSQASASLANAQAGVVGQTPEQRNFGFMQTLPPEQQGQFGVLLRNNQGVMQDPVVAAANKALLDAYTDPIKRAGLSTEQLKQAELLMNQAGGQVIVPKRVPAGQQGSGAPTVSNALQQARDAIAKGADKNAVIERLKKNGIDPTGL